MTNLHIVPSHDETRDSIHPLLHDGGAASQPQSRPLAHHAYLSSFVGRDAEISWIRDRLAAGQRLITISGPGGVGKTRLAYAVADSVRNSERFPDGFAVVPLASVADEHLVIPTIARAIGVVVENDGSPVDRLALALQVRQMVLVLDNLEHVIGASLELRELLDACPDLAMLVTSRRALRVGGEQEFALAPFPIPGFNSSVSIEQLASSPSIALFVDRAVAVSPGFSITSENAGAVIDICSRLDGLPLAIELAAARIKILPLQALASRLSDRLQLLVSGPRDAPARQQTLREALAWSYDLLSPDEQHLFRRISVFAGGATLDAIETVASLSGTDQTLDPLKGIAGLLDQSMLVRDDTSSTEPRFRMLETIREYGMLQLDQHGEAEAVRDAHAAYFLSIAQRASGSPYGPEESALIKRLDPEVDNVRAALNWLLIEHPEDTDRAKQGLWLAGSMGRFWDLRGYVSELEAWLTLGLAQVPDEPVPERGIAFNALGIIAWGTFRGEECVAWHERALEVWHVLDAAEPLAGSYWILGLEATDRGDVPRVRDLIAKIEEQIPRLGVSLWVAAPPGLRAMVAYMEGDTVARKMHLEETISYLEQHGFRWPRAWAIGEMAHAHSVDGDLVKSMETWQQCLAELWELGDIYGVLDSMTMIAGLAIGFGQARASAAILGAIHRARISVGNRRTWSFASEHLVIANARTALGEREFEAEQARTESMQLPEAIAIALDFQAGSGSSPTGGKSPSLSFGLTPREIEILRLLTEGRSNQEIGDELFISPRTAGTHVANILGKLGVHSRAAAVSVAHNQKLV